mmetsp:Transcript_591/g.1578  ORF Transcript_591/g.1578 Transcript_591/m.1578 type:complete len:246 (+) Transcript_591:332-1069(+)
MLAFSTDVLEGRVAIRGPKPLFDLQEHLPTPLAILGVLGQFVHVPPSLNCFWSQNVLSGGSCAQIEQHILHALWCNARGLLLVHLPTGFCEVNRQLHMTPLYLPIFSMTGAKGKPSRHETSEVFHLLLIPVHLRFDQEDVAYKLVPAGSIPYHVLLQTLSRTVVHPPQIIVLLAAQDPDLQQILIERITIGPQGDLPAAQLPAIRPQSIDVVVSLQCLVKTIHLLHVGRITRDARQIADLKLHRP